MVCNDGSEVNFCGNYYYQNELFEHSMKLSELFVKEPISLELLLQLKAEGSLTILQIYDIAKDITIKVSVIDMLKILKECNVINTTNNVTSITNTGKFLISSLKQKIGLT